MRKQKWPPPIYQRRGKDYLRLRTASGQIRERVLGDAGSDSSRIEYARILAELETMGRVAKDRAQGLSVQALIAAYWPHAEGHNEHRQAARIRRALEEAGALYGPSLAESFGPLSLRAVRERFVGAGYCRRYCNQLTDCIRGMFRWASGEELVAHPVYAALKDVPGLRAGHTDAPDHERIEPARIEDVERTIPHMTPIISAMVRLQLATGMRPGEVCLVRPADVERGWRAVEGREVWLYVLDRHKTAWRGHLRWIPIGPMGQSVLEPYMDRDPEAYCFSPRESSVAWLRDHGRRVRMRRRRAPGERYDTQSYGHAVAKACRRAGTAWTPNQLRHSVATTIETRYGREDARCVLGHTTPSTTAIYAQSVERAAEVMARCG